MQLQDLSYALNNQKISISNKSSKISYLLSSEVISFENVYTAPNLEEKEGKYSSSKLVWGNDVEVDGSICIDTKEDGFENFFVCSGRLDKPIRSIKFRFDNLPIGKLVSSIDEDKQITKRGLLLHYPEGWRSLSWPLLVFDLEDDRYLYIYCKDKTVNKKTFFMKKVGEGMRVDVVCEQAGRLLDNKYTTPMVYVGITSSIHDLCERVSNDTKLTYGLSEFENSEIVPSWLKDINLVLTMHMEAFTGKIFHTYKDALEDVRKICKYIDGKHVLVYFAGWEGRYYYKYGNYTPDSRLGGEEELIKSIKGMHELGCKVMLMYGMNMVNKTIPGLKNIVEESEFVTAGGGRFHSGSVNWEGAHHYDFDELAQLNIASKPWADNLCGQIKRNSLLFDADGAFLDIAACYVNDRNHNEYEGLVEFASRLRGIKKDFLVSGEGYYDGMSKAMPLFQSGHTDGKMHYHTRLDESLFTRYSREFAHLCLGDPSRGSTGVHEQGTNTDIRTPLEKGIIPTLCLVDGSVENGWDEVMKTIEQAREYGRLYGEKKAD